MTREATRFLAQWTLQPLAVLLAEEATEKLGAPVSIDVMRPLHAYDAGGRARALLTITQALAMAKEGAVSPADIAEALELVDFGDA